MLTQKDFFLIINDWIIPIGVLFISYLCALLFFWFIKRIVHRFTQYTKTRLDDICLEALKKPIYYAILLLGLKISLSLAPYISDFQKTTDSIITVLASLIGIWATINIIKSLWEWMFIRRNLTVSEKTSYIVIQRTINIAIYIIGILVLLSQLGVAISPIIASLGIGGIAVALALQDTLSNYFASIYLTTDKSIHIGDFIELDGTNIKGIVTKVSWRATQLKSSIGNTILIPNSKLAESTIINQMYPKPPQILPISLGVSYDDDLEKVEKITLKVAQNVQKKVSGAINNHKPLFCYKEFGDNSINFTILLKVKSRSDKFSVRNKFIKDLKKAYDKENISIPFPQTDIWIRSALKK